MESLRETSFFKETLHVLNYSFGDIFLYDKFIVAEYNEGELISWDTVGKLVVDDIRNIYGIESKELIYISNRVNKYSVVPSDWIKFKKNDCSIRGYAIISYGYRSYLNALLEKVFYKTKLQFFNSLENAIIWARQN